MQYSLNYTAVTRLIIYGTINLHTQAIINLPYDMDININITTEDNLII